MAQNLLGGQSRLQIIDTIGKQYLTENIENGEFSYQQVIDRHLSGNYKLDIRFYDESKRIAVLVETKQSITANDKKQLFAYVTLEQELSAETKIIAILASTHTSKIRVWKVHNGMEEELEDRKLKSFEEYADYFKPQNINNKTRVLENTSQLNRLLHDNGIIEDLRSQFVGTCLLALNNGLVYEKVSAQQIIVGIKEILGHLLSDSIDKANKLAILYQRVLQDECVQKLSKEGFCKILNFIKIEILPYINNETYRGQDILSHFFTTFNKYVGRNDKNQAFTPNHIAHFMCMVGNVNRNSRVLDPTCGSGTFLVQAMTQALSKCETAEEKQRVKNEQIYGIEKDEKVYGLATTNMLIHSDGNSNIINESCFEKGTWISNANINLVLMNPPYNASKTQVPEKFAKTWGKTSTDPSKGLYFVNYVADSVKHGRLIALLPMQCAIKTEGVIAQLKAQLLQEHTLDAVFSFPPELFYPGASAVVCCMVFDLGVPHRDSHRETFFGYYKDDGFEKRKGVGRIDVNNRWNDIENEWMNLYLHRETKAGMSVCQYVEEEDEWCAEAYMETDYSQLTDEDFIHKMRDYAAFLVQNERINNGNE